MKTEVPERKCLILESLKLGLIGHVYVPPFMLNYYSSIYFLVVIYIQITRKIAIDNIAVTECWEIVFIYFQVFSQVKQ